MIDLDPQASAAKWSDRRVSETPVVLSAHASRLPKELERVRAAGGEVLFLDTAPHSDSAALDAARIADLVLVPCRPAILDLEAVTNTLGLVRATATPVAVVLNGVAPQGHEADEAAEAVAALGVELCPVRPVQRVAFARSLIAGQTAQEFEPEGKAAHEASALHAWVWARVHKCTTRRPPACPTSLPTP